MVTHPGPSTAGDDSATFSRRPFTSLTGKNGANFHMSLWSAPGETSSSDTRAEPGGALRTLRTRFGLSSAA